jgi:hypothetical protein
MKTVIVTTDHPQLRELVEEAYNGGEVILALGEKKVKLERYHPAGGAATHNLEEDGSELEAELLSAVRSSFTPYSRRDLEGIAERVRREKA